MPDLPWLALAAPLASSVSVWISMKESPSVSFFSPLPFLSGSQSSPEYCCHHLQRPFNIIMISAATIDASSNDYLSDHVLRLGTLPVIYVALVLARITVSPNMTTFIWIVDTTIIRLEP